jgi:hypothetical protein
MDREALSARPAKNATLVESDERMDGPECSQTARGRQLLGFSFRVRETQEWNAILLGNFDLDDAIRHARKSG